MILLLQTHFINDGYRNTNFPITVNLITIFVRQ